MGYAPGFGLCSSNEERGHLATRGQKQISCTRTGGARTTRGVARMIAAADGGAQPPPHIKRQSRNRH